MSISHLYNRVDSDPCPPGEHDWRGHVGSEACSDCGLTLAEVENSLLNRYTND